jgi:Bardet-Biedl syndrome 1 protein
MPIYNLKLCYAFDTKLYKIPSPNLNLPTLVPNVPYPVETIVESIDATGTNDNIKVFVFETKKQTPVITAMINMPLSELKIE